jgi:hypothetical protein
MSECGKELHAQYRIQWAFITASEVPDTQYDTQDKRGPRRLVDAV